MKRRKFNFLFVICYFLFIICFSACSTAPKKPTEVFSIRSIATSQLNLANELANRGHYDDALLALVEARRLAVSTDDPPLRVKTSISRGNILFSLGRHDEAFTEWERAAVEGDYTDQPAFTALARIYIIRARLILLSNESEDGKNPPAAEEYRAQLSQQMSAVRSDSLSIAAGYVTLGILEKLAGRWGEAESAVMRSLSIHEKDRYLEDAAYDWFLIASIRSMSGNYTTALTALRTGIRFDRRAENGFGLASSWRAIGDVLMKAERQGFRAAYRRAIEIYRALSLDDKAEELEAILAANPRQQ